jgi:hypothetical protein
MLLPYGYGFYFQVVSMTELQGNWHANLPDNESKPKQYRIPGSNICFHGPSQFLIDIPVVHYEC